MCVCVCVCQPFNQLYITNKTECLSFKSARAVQELTKEDWPMVLATVRISTLDYFQKVLSLKYWSIKQKN